MSTAQYYGNAIGAPPIVTTLKYKQWFLRLLKQRVEECPVERSADYFFSTSGNNAHDGRDGLGLALASATWTPSTMTLSKTGGFTGYTWVEGDQIYLASGTGITAGLYEIASRTSNDAVVLAESPGSVVATNVASSNGPKQTIAALQTILDTDPTDKRYRLKRGDVWKETTGLSISATSYSLTISDFGNKALASPLISKFTATVAPASWAATAGKANVYEVVAAVVCAGVRYENDVTTVFRQQVSINDVRDNLGSWYSDGAKIYVSLHDGWDPTTGADHKLEYVVENDLSGCTVEDGAYDIRFQNVVTAGWGLNAAYDAGHDGAGFLLNHSGQANVVLGNCESYYNNKHNFFHTATDGGITTMVTCKYGRMLGTSAVHTNADDGRNELINFEGTCVGGVLPTGQTPYAYGAAGNSTSFSTDGGPTHTVGLVISWGEEILPGQYQVLVGFTGTDAPVVSTLGDYRALVFGENFNSRDKTAFDITGPATTEGKLCNALIPENCVAINCRYNAKFLDDGGVAGNTGALDSTTSGLMINCTFVADFTGATMANVRKGRALFLTYVGFTGKWYNCTFHIKTAGGDNVTLFKDAYTANTNGQVPDLVAKNCIFSAEGFTNAGGTFGLGIGNTSAKQFNNAYVHAVKAGTYVGYTNDGEAVELHAPVLGPVHVTSPLVKESGTALVEGYRLEYDANWTPRDSNKEVIGPYTYETSYVTGHIEAVKYATVEKVQVYR